MKIKKLICLILGITLSFAVTGCSCKSCKEDVIPPDENPTQTGDGTSYYNVTETDYNFVKYGKSDFKIVIPKDADVNEKLAYNDLNVYLEEATGVKLDVLTDDKVEFNNDNKYISIGNTSLLQKSNLKIDNDLLQSSAFQMKTIGKTLYLYGSDIQGANYGVIYAAHQFLKEMVDLEFYSDDCCEYTKTYKLKMKSFDVLEIPDYDYRSVSTVRKDDNYSRKLRNKSGYKRREGSVHTQFFYLPKEKYFADHPDWYTGKQNQLRLINEEMTKEFIESVKNHLRAKPDVQQVHIGNEDNMGDFSPADAAETKRLYNTTEPGLNIVFCNKVINAIEAWLPTEFPGRYITYQTSAYYNHSDAPVSLDEATGKYVPHSDWVIPHEKLCIQLIFMARPNWGEPLTAESNKSYYENIMKWSSICDNFSVYSYGINFRAYLMNFNNFGSFEHDVRFGYEHGFTGWYELLASNTATPNFEELRLYVQSKLLWDTSLNYMDLAEDFIRAYYKDAAPKVLEYFKLTVNNLFLQKAEQDMPQGITISYLAYAKYWPFELVDKMAKVLDEGEKALDYLKETNSEEYDILVNRVRQQKVTVQYLQMQHYQNNYGKSEIDRILDEMDETVKRNKFLRTDERDAEGSVALLITGWREKNV